MTDDDNRPHRPFVASMFSDTGVIWYGPMPIDDWRRIHSMRTAWANVEAHGKELRERLAALIAKGEASAELAAAARELDAFLAEHAETLAKHNAEVTKALAPLEPLPTLEELDRVEALMRRGATKLDK